MSWGPLDRQVARGPWSTRSNLNQWPPTPSILPPHPLDSRSTGAAAPILHLHPFPTPTHSLWSRGLPNPPAVKEDPQPGHVRNVPKVTLPAGEEARIPGGGHPHTPIPFPQQWTLSSSWAPPPACWYLLCVLLAPPADLLEDMTNDKTEEEIPLTAKVSSPFFTWDENVG